MKNENIWRLFDSILTICLYSDRDIEDKNHYTANIQVNTNLKHELKHK